MNKMKRAMKRTNKIIVILIILLMNIPPSALAIITPGLDSITLENPQGLKNKLFPEVEFTHKKHYVDYELTCLTCHHNWKTDERDNPGKCIECHKRYIDDTNRKAVMFRNAFHRSCQKCHRHLRDNEQTTKTGPVKCRGCHLILKESKN